MSGFSDILGHSAALHRLWDALSRDALHHAYLFEGPQGVGKRTVAMRLAMAANCEGDAATPPCGVCRPCRTIAAGTHPDVIVLEPAADRATPIIRVDQVREVVRIAGFHRYNAKHRFVVVDPAEAMQDPAANALLKTLEEPPAGTGFILLATHARSLLPTIVSRCQRIRFSAVPDEALAGWLRDRGVDDADDLARAALGCPGRALSLADGTLAERRALRDALIATLGGRVGRMFDLSAEVCRGRRQEWRPRVDGLLDIIDDLLRDVVVHGAGAKSALLNADRPEIVAAWATALYPDGVTRCAEAIWQAREQLDLNVTGKTCVDAVLTRLATELGRRRVN